MAHGVEGILTAAERASLKTQIASVELRAREIAHLTGVDPQAAEFAALREAGLLPARFQRVPLPVGLSAAALHRIGHNPFNFPWLRHLPVHSTGMPFFYRSIIRAALLRELELRHHFTPVQIAAIMHAIDVLWNGHHWPRDGFVWDFPYGHGSHGLVVRGPHGEFAFLDAMGQHLGPVYRPPVVHPHSEPHGHGLVEA
jgi:hypothetical protein